MPKLSKDLDLIVLKTRFFVTKWLCALLALALLIWGLCSCGETEDFESTVISFTDALGRNVTVGQNPERVAALIGSFAEVWTLAGGELVAAAEDAWDDFGLEVDGVNIGGAHSPNTELLLAAEPDFVLASASTAANVELRELLESMGITVAYFDVDSFDDYLKMLEVCTYITGRDDLYRQNGLDIKKRIDEIKSENVTSDLDEREKRVLVLRAASGFIKAKGSQGTVLGEMLSDIGLVNIADGDGTLLETLSAESIIKADPYRIFVVTMGDSAAAMENVKRELLENPAFGGLEAVKNGRIHYMDRHLFNLKPNARWAEAYEELCEIIGK